MHRLFAMEAKFYQVGEVTRVLPSCSSKALPGCLPGSACTVCARRDERLSRQPYCSIFVCAASSFVLPFFSWFFLPLCTVLSLWFTSSAAPLRLFGRFAMAVLSHVIICIVLLIQEQHLGISVWSWKRLLVLEHIWTFR